jgi:hypothetical protein
MKMALISLDTLLEPTMRNQTVLNAARPQNRM